MLVNANQNAHAAVFDAGNLPGGMYFFRLAGGKYSHVKISRLSNCIQDE